MIRGRRPEQPERVYLHRGIAGATVPSRCSCLAEGLEVVSAALDKGVLTIDLRRPATLDQGAHDRHPDPGWRSSAKLAAR